LGADRSGAQQDEAVKVDELPDLEKVAAQVHAAWVDAKRAQGITSKMAEDGEELMVAYELLSEKAKDLDRTTVRAVYAAIVRST
jgi:hypothetical protein